MKNMEDNNLIMLLGEMKSDIRGLHEKTDALLTQAKITNGRVNEIEDWKANLMGKLTIITAMVTSIIGTVTAFIFKMFDE